MNLKCTINDIEYSKNLVQGITVSEEYNETLDSGSIIISNVNKIEDLRPYDDVYLYDGKFDGYREKEWEYSISSKTIVSLNKSEKKYSVYLPYKEIQKKVDDNSLQTIKIKIRFYYSDSSLFKEPTFEITNINKKLSVITNDGHLIGNLEISENGNFVFTTNYFAEYAGKMATSSKIISSDIILKSINVYKDNKFFKHFLVDQFSEEMLNIRANPKDVLYRYKIQLFSETKKLEIIQIPNFSVTQSINLSKKNTVYYYLKQVIDMYSPLIKFVVDEENGIWEYRKKYCIDDSLEKIFDDVYCPDFSLNNPSLRDVLSKLMVVKDMIPYVENDVIKAMDITERKKDFEINPQNITGVFSSLSSDGYCYQLKRNYSDAISESTSCQITEVLGFRNSNSALLTLGDLQLETRYPIYKINKIYMCYYKKGTVYKGTIDKYDTSSGKEKVFLCKQDITPLVKLDSERNLLSMDWREVEWNVSPNFATMQNYKFMTVQYSIGSNKITGWGEKYSYQPTEGSSWWTKEATTIENIAKNIDRINPYGIYDAGYIETKDSEYSGEYFFKADGERFFNSYVNPFSNDSVGLKGLFFEISYNAFFNGTIIHSKESDRDDITTNDNSSSSLTILEYDGLYQKEKVNRLGNKTMQIKATYTDISQIQDLGSVYNYGSDNDIIIYHREISIFNNVINVIYYGSKDYVLKNYFVSVFAKHRTYNLMSYGESVRRSENRKMYILLSKNKLFYEKNENNIKIKDDDKLLFINKLLSFSNDTQFSDNTSLNDIEYADKLNCAYIDINDVRYASDINTFVSGTSICFNVSMFDNASNGICIDTKHLGDFINLSDAQNSSDYVIGSIQKWYMAVDDSETGVIEKMGIYVCHSDFKDEFCTEKLISENEAEKIVTNKILALPLLTTDKSNFSNVIGNEYTVMKDNKELIDMTFQFELETNNNDKDIVFSDWALKLSDLLGSYNKFGEDKLFYVKNNDCNAISACVYYENKPTQYQIFPAYYPCMIIQVPTGTTFEKGDEIKSEFYFRKKMYIVRIGAISSFSFAAREVYDVEKDEDGNVVAFILKGTAKIRRGFSSEVDSVWLVKFKKNNNFLNTEHPDGYDWYSSVSVERTPDSSSYPIKISYYRTGTAISIGEGLYSDIESQQNGVSTTCVCAPAGKIIKINEELNRSNAVYRRFYFSRTNSKFEGKIEKNLYLVASEKEVKKTIVYNNFQSKEMIDGEIIDAFLCEQVIYFGETNEGLPALVIDVNMVMASYSGKNIKSIQVWYDNSQVYSSADGASTKIMSIGKTGYHFVFGVNITEEDIKNGKIYIYASLLSTKERRVFDSTHKKVGEVYDYTKGDKQYGEEQYYSVD